MNEPERQAQGLTEQLTETTTIGELSWFEGRAIEAKAERHIAAVYSVGYDALEALRITAYFMRIRGRDSVALTTIAHWSGARWRWKKRINEGIKRAIEDELLATKAANVGYSVRVTEKGRVIERAFNQRFQELREQYEIREKPGQP